MSSGGLTRLFRLVVEHPVAMSMIFLAALVFGLVSYTRLSVELMPDISYPSITVRTPFEGAAPEEVETQISRLLESRLSTLDGLVSLESRSRANQSDVVLGFSWGTDMSDASQSVRESLQTVFLPEGAQRPMILRYDPSLDPFLRVALSVERSEVEDEELTLFLLRDVAERELKRELEAMEGVAAVQVKGGLEREIRVDVREDWLAARKVTLASVQSLLATENVNMAGGSILEGNTEYLIRTLNEFVTLDDIRALKISRGDGTRIPLTDVAEVYSTHRERDVISHLDGEPAVELEIYKEADANVVQIAEEVKRRLFGTGAGAFDEALGGDKPLVDALPDAFHVGLLDDQAAFIESAVSNLRNTVLLGGILAVIVLFLFLRNVRATMIIGLAIPISVIVGFAPLNMLGVSLNLMSLGGLALGVGMLVDNAVVVLESIQRYLDEGEERIPSAIRGTSDVAGAVTASTLTTVAVFLPIAFVEGVAGELFGDLSIAVVSSLIASLAVALFLVPTMAAERFPSAALGLLAGAFYFYLIIGGYTIAAVGIALIASALLILFLVRTLLTHPDGGDSLSDPIDESKSLTFTSLVHKAKGSVLQPLTFARVETGDWVSRAVSPAMAVSLRLTQNPSEPPTLGRRLWAWLSTPYSVGKIVLMAVTSIVANLMVLSLVVCARLALVVGWFVSWPMVWFVRMSGQLFATLYEPVDRAYSHLLPRVLRRPGAVLGGTAVLAVLALGAGSRLGTELIPELHQGRFTVEAALPVGTPLEETTREVALLEQILKDEPGIETVYTVVGADQRADTGGDEGEHTARLRVQLTPGGNLAQAEERVMASLRTKLGRSTRMTSKMVRPALFSFRTPVEVVVVGYDLAELRGAGERVAEQLSSMPGLTDVRSSMVQGYPELRVVYDRARLHQFGLDTNTVATRIRNKIQGVEATAIHQGDRKVDVRVQLKEGQRSTVSDLKGLNVNPSLIPPIPLDAVATVEEGFGPSEIRRVDQQRSVVISANVTGFDLGSASREIETVLSDVKLPEGVYYELAGQAREMQSSLSSLQFALLLAIFLVYVIMASSFESLIHPFVILFSVPLGVVGVVLSLWLVGIDLSVVVFIGAIVLAGVVVNNAIVLVDTINRFRQDGVPRDEAIAAAAKLRLRPILITTMTTALGLTPLAVGPALLSWLPTSLAFGEGVEIQQPLAITVIGGLLSATLLTLVVVPVLYKGLTRAKTSDAASASAL